LAERINAIGVTPVLPTYARYESSSVCALLGDDAPILRAEMDRHLRKRYGEKFIARSKEAIEARRLAQEVHANLETSQNAAYEAEVLSLLLERSIHISESRPMHEELIGSFGPIPSSVCEMAALKLEQKDAEGAESMLEIFEKRPLMSGEAKKFLQFAYHIREQLPVEMLWMKEWIEKPQTISRIEEAFSAYNAQNKIFCDSAKEKPVYKPCGFSNWHIELIVKSISERFPVRRIWLAECETPAGFNERVFRMLVEITTENLEYEIGAIGGRACMPGPISRDFGTSLQIAEHKELRTIRDYQPALIYEDLTGSLAKAA
jgi:hypothetical protein